MITSKRGRARLRGVDSVYVKHGAVLAVCVDDIVLAGGPRARRRQRTALQGKLALGCKPERARRFLGVRYWSSDVGQFERAVGEGQSEYVA